MIVPLKRLAFHASRRVEGLVPPDVLWFIILPLAALRALRDMRTGRRDMPAGRLPAGPQDRRPSAAARFGMYLGTNMQRPVLAWSDRLTEPRWQQRITVVGVEHLGRAIAQPVIVATVHTRSTVMVNAWLRAQKVPVGTVASDPRFLADPVMRVRMELGNAIGPPRQFLPGSGLAIARFLQPGHVLMVAIDAPRGRTVEGTWRARPVRLATGAFRLARKRAAIVLPMVGTETGRWRWRLVIGPPIPAEMLADARYAQAASWFAASVLPEVAAHPNQAGGTLVDALQRHQR